MSISYSDHVCTNFEPKSSDKDRWADELREHLCCEINKLYTQVTDLLEENDRLRDIEQKLKVLMAAL